MILSSKVKLALVILGGVSGLIQAGDGFASRVFIHSFDLVLEGARKTPGLNAVCASLIESGDYYVHKNHRAQFSEIFKKNFQTVFTGILAMHLFLVFKSSDYRKFSLGTHLVLGGGAILFLTSSMSNHRFGKQLEEAARNKPLEEVRAEMQALKEGLEGVNNKLDKLVGDVAGLRGVVDGTNKNVSEIKLAVERVESATGVIAGSVGRLAGIGQSNSSGRFGFLNNLFS
jgi:uncharacterized protein YoxC